MTIMSNNKLKVIIFILFFIVVSAGIWLTAYSEYVFSLVLQGKTHVELRLCEYYEDQGVKAKYLGMDASDKVEVESNLDTQTPGEYEITYTMAHLTVTRHITVGDEMEPVIQLNESGTPEILLGEEYEEEGYSAFDNNGTDLTDEVEVIAGELNKAGNAQIWYKVTDADGNCTAVAREINVLPNTEYDAAGLPICMYHYVYDKNEPPENLNKKYKNYIEQNDLIEEFEWLKAEGYYFPTWEEVRAYVDGELILPEKSIVICFDDAAQDFLDYGVPVIDQCEIPTTCFIVTKWSGDDKVRKYQSTYLTYQSHSHDMHKGGGSIGHGGIFTALSHDEALQDLLTSIEICGNGDAFAYPYGDYTQECRDIVEEAGFDCAVTTVYGKAYPGMDPMLLPRIRMNNDQTLEQFISMVAPPETEEYEY